GTRKSVALQYKPHCDGSTTFIKTLDLDKLQEERKYTEIAEGYSTEPQRCSVGNKKGERWPTPGDLLGLALSG
ncbi:MAG: hypothetical protein ACO34J_14580, partial [Prochlorothrix sp.]